MNKKLIIGLFPVLMAFALPSLFLSEKEGSINGKGEVLRQYVARKFSAVTKKLSDESVNKAEDVDRELLSDLKRADEVVVTEAMLEQALREHGLAPALVFAFHGKKNLFLKEIRNMGALDLEGLKDGYDAGVLHWSVMGNCLECVKAGLKKGLNVNAKNSRGETPLVFAVSDGDVEMAHYLISVGADPNVIANNVGYTLLMDASFEGLTDLASLIIKADGNVLAADEEGKTAIHYAAKEGYSEVVALLVKALKEKGLNPSTTLAKRDAQGKSALDYASEYRHKKVLKILHRL